MSVEGISWFYVCWNWTNTYLQEIIHFFYYYKICRQRSYYYANTHIHTHTWDLDYPGGLQAKRMLNGVTWTVCYFFSSLSRLSYKRPPLPPSTTRSNYMHDKKILHPSWKNAGTKLVYMPHVFMHSWFKLDVTELVFFLA